VVILRGVDANHEERVQLQRAFEALSQLKGALESLPREGPNDRVVQWAQDLRWHCSELRGVPTKSRLSGSLRKVSDEALAFADQFSQMENPWALKQDQNIPLQAITRAMRSVDSRLEHLRRELVGKASPLIDTKIGNHRYTVYSLAAVAYVGGLLLSAHAIGLSQPLVFLSFALVVVLLVCVIDISMVVYTRPYWLYLPSEDSLAARIVNWNGLWTLLIPTTLVLLLTTYMLAAGLIVALSMLLSSAATGNIIGAFALLCGGGILLKYAQWRKGEYLLCPWCPDKSLSNRGALSVHCRQEHGIELEKAVDELRQKLSNRKPQSVLGFRSILGCFLLGASWFLCYETLLLFKFADYYRFGILVLADIILIGWPLHLLTATSEKLPKNIPEGIRKRSAVSAWSATFKFVTFGSLGKLFLFLLIGMPLTDTVGAQIGLWIMVATLSNTGFVQIFVVYATQGRIRAQLSAERWKRVLSLRKSAIWIATIYSVYLIMASLSIMGGFSYLEIMRFSYLSADLILFAWATEIWTELRFEFALRKGKP